MACEGCSCGSSTSTNGSVKGCNSNGCASGGCNRLNTYDWLSQLEIEDTEPLDIVEISFKNGARKNFYRQPEGGRCHTGDMVVVETGNGYDVGRITLSGELVRLQMKKKRCRPEQVTHAVIRRANQRDLERLQEAREMETSTMVRSRAIARTLGLDMKIGDVEYQGDKRKATFYYTANGRVDFRELIRHFAREFRIKVEMRQIGSRQESARIGGLGSCGRELCCSTWLTDFKSVSTAAARYQNLAINQAKLSGQCGRLKCCLNYELDTYMEAIDAFPNHADRLETEAGKVVLVKTDIFRQLMYYAYLDGNGRGKLYALTLEQVREIIDMNRKGKRPTELSDLIVSAAGGDEEHDYEDVTGAVELPPEQRNKRRKKRKKKGGQEQRAGAAPVEPSKKQLTRHKSPKAETAEPRAKSGPKEERGGGDGQGKQNQKRRSNRNRRGRNKRGGGDGNNKSEG